MRKGYVKVWDTEDFRFAFVDIKNVADYYNRFKNDYENIDEFLNIHCISKKHKQYIIDFDIELEDYYANICDELQEKYGNGFFYQFSISYNSDNRLYTINLQERQTSQKETLVMNYDELRERLL